MRESDEETYTGEETRQAKKHVGGEGGRDRRESLTGQSRQSLEMHYSKTSRSFAYTAVYTVQQLFTKFSKLGHSPIALPSSLVEPVNILHSKQKKR